MSSYSYRTSYSSGDLARNADAAFAQADANRDGRIDINEFRNLAGQNVVGAGYSSGSTVEAVGYGGAYGAAYGAGYGGAGSSVYESAAYDGASSGLVAGAGAYDAAYVAGGYGAGAGAYGASGAVVQQYATDARGLFVDSNPQIIRRPAPGGVQTYTQNIRVRFLQPPPVPPHGPLIIREVRPPQPPVPQPLRIRQVAPPLPTPPALVLRERPPRAPVSIPSQTVIRRLAALPVPPRSVIIERLPPLPPRPRDIVIERWIPYGAQAKRRTILQRAGPAIQYPRPRNVIIQYDTAPVRVVRQFQRLGVAAASPAAYVQQYGASLLDAGSLVASARSAGVVEDISPPGFVGASVAAVGYGAGTYGFEGAVADAGVVGGYSTGVVSAVDAGVVDGGYSTYESSGYSTGVGYGAGYGAGYGVAGGVDVVGSAFAAADANGDGTLDQGEFRNFVGQGAGSSSYESYSSTTAY